MYRTLADFAAEIIRSFKLDLDWFDIGGGFYGGGPANVGAYDEYVRTIREAIGDVCDPTHTELLVEPGGAVVCTPGYYVGRVIDVKDIVDEHYVVTELSRINIDHEMKKTSYVHEMVTSAQETLPRQIICGYTCMDSDRLFTAHDEPALRTGDAVVIRYAGRVLHVVHAAVLHRIPAGSVRRGARRPADAIARTLERATAERLIITFQHSAAQ